ncbi:hypothetical protein [Microbulbifer sp. SAOS-129_SWC]|uniref:hypothetical protein n=1 Tax=Microbulbifer sp. SAOS-129_SWC TaxID=3145235 RepID=UPI00321777F6
MPDEMENSLPGVIQQSITAIPANAANTSDPYAGPHIPAASECRKYPRQHGSLLRDPRPGIAAEKFAHADEILR